MLALAENRRPAVELLAEQSGHVAADIIAVGSNELKVHLKVRHADGASKAFLLRIETSGRSATARELTPCNLPAFCPMRHINSDGTFCLYWTALDNIAITDAKDANAWWETVLKFLMQQRRAARRGFWPDNRERAHGAAALNQHRAELAAAAIGETIANDLAAGRLAVTARLGRHRKRVLRVLRNGQRFYSVSVNELRVLTKRRRCVCAVAEDHHIRAISSCGNHHKFAVNLALELDAQNKAEAQFWRNFAGRTCCGTMSGCPLGTVG